MTLFKSIAIILILSLNEFSQQNINSDEKTDNNEINKLFVSPKSVTHSHCSDNTDNQLSKTCDNNQNIDTNNKSKVFNKTEDNINNNNVKNEKNEKNEKNIENKRSDSSNELSSETNNTLIDVQMVQMVQELPSVPTPATPNEMLSFEEWRKKIAEKELISETLVSKSSSHTLPQLQPSIPLTGQLPQNTKKSITKRTRNFGSYECGAKVVDTNPEAEFVHRILNEQTDEYMLNPCKAKIWFVIELCETIQPQNIELANFELYSSVPKEFNIQASDHYPTRDWSSLGTFTALDERRVQRFQLQNNGFVKYIKIEMLSHYGSEHFCPLSVIRIFGTSLFDEVDRIDNINNNDNSQTINDEDNESSTNEQLIGEDASAQNLFGTARDAVFNIVRKAAQALNGNAIELIENQINGSVSSELNIIRLESNAIKLYPKISQYFKYCNESNNNLNNKTFTTISSQMCLYLKCLFGDFLFNLLYKQYLELNLNNSENRSLFQCFSFPRNISEKLVNIESSLNIKVPDIIPSTDTIIRNSKSLSNENISPNKSISSNASQGIKTIINETISEDMSESIEATIIPTLTSESISIETKTEEFSTITTTDNREYKNLNNSESLNNSNNSTKVEEMVKNSVQNELPSLSSGQTVNGNGHTVGSVVLRLSNRIKALEVNLSLSSQYLEELSQRYRKQMEEMQRAFNITISKLNDTASRAAEKDLKQQESIGLMESKLNVLNDKMILLLSERESLNWHYIEVHIGLMMIEVIVVIALLFICVYRLSKRIRFLQTNQTIQTVTKHLQQNNSHNVMPIKRLHPYHNNCHLPAKTQKIEGDIKSIDYSYNNNMAKVERKIRKKRKKKTNGTNLTNILVPETDSQHNSINKFDENKSLLIAKSQSTPVLSSNTTVITNTNSNTNTNTNSNTNNIDVNKSRNSSCHSSSSGFSSISSNPISNQNVFASKPSKFSNEIHFDKKSLNDKLLNSKKQNEKCSLTFNLKKLLKIERK